MLSWQSLWVLVVAILHANQALGKPPYESQESVMETGRSFIEANIMPNQDVNETSVSRGSVDPSSTDEYLENYCPQERLRPSPPGHPCEAGSFKCHGYEEIVVQLDKLCLS